MSQKSSELKAWMGDNSNMRLNICNTLKVFIFFMVANVLFSTQAMASNFIIDYVDDSLDETGGTGNIVISLDSTFSSNYVMVGFHISDDTEAEFSSGNYHIYGYGGNSHSDNLTMTITGISDNILDGDIDFDLSFKSWQIATAIATALIGGGGNVNDLIAASDNIESSSNTFTTLDTDTAGITIGELSGNLSGNVSEAGNTATFSVQLDAGESSGDNVLIYFASSNTSEVDFLSGGNFVDLTGITADNITLVGVSDSGNILDGDQTALIYVSSVSSNAMSGGNYTGDVVSGNINGAGNNFSVINQDSDEAGITVLSVSGNLSSGNMSAGNVSEIGEVAVIQVHLDAIPWSGENVTIYFTSSDNTEVEFVGGVNTLTLEGQVSDNISVYGVVDNVADEDATEWIYISSVTSANAHYNGLSTTTGVNITNINTDEGIFLGTISGDVDEFGAGNTATFSVNLATISEDDVTISFSSSNTNELTLSTNSTLTTNGANIEYVTVAGVSDNFIDGDQLVYVSVNTVSSDNASYGALDPTSLGNVEVTVTDTDVAGITFGAISGDTTESGGSANFTIKLDTIPAESGSAIVTLSVNDSSEFQFDNGLTIKSVTLTGITPQLIEIEGVDDNIDEQNYSESGTISITDVQSLDLNYHEVAFADTLTVNNVDEGETADVVYSPSSNPSATEGGSVDLVFYLGSQPEAEVTITPTGDAELTFSPTSLTFAADASYSTNQTITVTVADDGVVSAIDPYPVSFTVEVDSADSFYDDALNGNVSVGYTKVNVTEDDSVGISFSAFSGNVREDGETATALVSLTSQPTGTGNVVLNITSGNTSELTLNTDILVFTTSDWDNGQTVEVVGVSDNIADGDQTVWVTASVNTTLSTTSDTDYDTASLSANASIDVIDVDSPGILLTQVESSLVEETGITSLRVYLNSSPGDGETITVSLSANTTDLVLDPESVQFDSTNYNAFKNISVSSNTDVSVNTVVTVTATISSGNYNASDKSVNYTILATEVAQFIVEADDFQTSEDGDTAEFTVALLAAPTTGVTVDIDTSDVNEVTISPSTLNFTTTNYATAQTVTLEGVDDADLDGLQSYTITLTGGNGNYSGVTKTLSFTNVDNDTASVQVAYDELKVTEWGTMQTVTLTLGVTPSDPVTLDLSVTDDTEAVLSRTSLEFDSSNSYTESFIVTGLDDDEEDGNQFFRVDFEQMSSANASYDGLTVSDLTFFNLDNELYNILVKKEGETTYSNLEDIVLTVQELADGESYQNFTLKLLSAPTGNVVINLDTSDNTEGTISPSQIVLDSLTESETITLTGILDEEADDIISFEVTLDIDESTTDPNFSSVPQLTIAANNESFDFRIEDNPDLDDVDGEKVFDWLVQSDGEITLTATQGLAPFDWTYSLDNVDSASITFADSTNTQATLVVGPYSTTYNFTIVDSRDSSDNTTTYDIYVQGNPIITSFSRPTLTTLKLFFEDLESTTTTNKRYYDVYYSEIVDPPVWTKINSGNRLPADPVTSKPASAFSKVNGKPTSISSLSVTVDYDGNTEGYFQLKASDNILEGEGNSAPDLSDDALTDDSIQAKYSVIEAEDQSVTNTLDQGGGGCLLR